MEVCESECVCVHEEAGSSIMAIYGLGRLWLMTDSHIPDSLDVGYVEHFSFFYSNGVIVKHPQQPAAKCRRNSIIKQQQQQQEQQ